MPTARSAEPHASKTLLLCCCNRHHSRVLSSIECSRHPSSCSLRHHGRPCGSSCPSRDLHRADQAHCSSELPWVSRERRQRKMRQKSMFNQRAAPAHRLSCSCGTPTERLPHSRYSRGSTGNEAVVHASMMATNRVCSAVPPRARCEACETSPRAAPDSTLWEPQVLLRTPRCQ